MSVWVKEGVCGDLSREMTKEHGRCVKFYASKGLDFFVTSRKEGNHIPGTFHYRGDAEDFRARGISYELLADHISAGFDLVQFWVGDVAFFHLEYDPKKISTVRYKKDVRVDI